MDRLPPWLVSALRWTWNALVDPHAVPVILIAGVLVLAGVGAAIDGLKWPLHLLHEELEALRLEREGRSRVDHP